MGSKRENWVDIAKGIGIILVVMGHACCPKIPHGIIYSFHMPLFFFLSGLFISKQCKCEFQLYLKKNFRSLLLPYFYFNLISIAFHYSMSVIFHKELLEGSVTDNIVGIFIGMRWGSQYHHVLWFLPCLFFAKMLIYPVFKYVNGGGKWIIGIMFLLIGLSYSKWEIKPLPMSLDASLIAAFFILCGNYYMKTKEIINKLVRRYWQLVLIVALFSIAFNFNKVEMYEMNYGNCLLFLLGSISSILLICSLSANISCDFKICSIIMEYGKLSLIVFAMHYYCLFIPITLKNRLLPNSLLWQDYMYWIASILICLILVLPVSKFINNKAKWLAGK